MSESSNEPDTALVKYKTNIFVDKFTIPAEINSYSTWIMANVPVSNVYRNFVPVYVLS